jgi:hypothetical protein
VHTANADYCTPSLLSEVDHLLPSPPPASPLGPHRKEERKRYEENLSRYTEQCDSRIKEAEEESKKEREGMRRALDKQVRESESQTVWDLIDGEPKKYPTTPSTANRTVVASRLPLLHTTPLLI